MSDFQFEVIGRSGGRLIRRKESERLRVWATEFDDAYGSQIEDFFSRGDTVSYAATAYMVMEEGLEGGIDSLFPAGDTRHSTTRSRPSRRGQPCPGRHHSLLVL